MTWFVRLACLMCAASVYPEPGSNSLVFCIYSLPFLAKFKPILFVDFSTSFCPLSFWVVGPLPLGFFSLWIYYLLFNVLSFLLPISAERFLFYYLSFRLSTPFLNFFQNLFLPLFRQIKKLVTAMLFFSFCSLPY